jgi:hypothetical protein
MTRPSDSRHQGFADRRARDVESFRQPPLLQRRIGRQFSGQDHVAKPLVSLVGQAFRRGPEDGKILLVGGELRASIGHSGNFLG